MVKRLKLKKYASKIFITNKKKKKKLLLNEKNEYIHYY